MNEYRTPLFMHLTRLTGLQHLDLACNDALITGACPPHQCTTVLLPSDIPHTVDCLSLW